MKKGQSPEFQVWGSATLTIKLDCLAGSPANYTDKANTFSETKGGDTEEIWKYSKGPNKTQPF